jgi:thiamine kinase-like enzyme
MSFNSEEVFTLATSLLSEACFHSTPLSISPIYQGGNNQLFHISNGREDFILKKYFSHKNDLRKRLENEYKFLELAQDVARPFIPLPLAKNLIEGVALYEFIRGDKLNKDTPVPSDLIEQAANFIYLLNKNTGTTHRDLSDASEACFSIQSHINMIDQRLNQLIRSGSNLIEFRYLLRDIMKTWGLTKVEIYENCSKNSIAIDQILLSNERILSPSDFGFHNALIPKNGLVKFVDFEYAGIDDPAKLICDFFNQVQIPVDKELFQSFVEIAFRGRSDIKSIAVRSKILMNAYSIKWCSIVLNIFLPNNFERRLFSNSNLDKNHLLESQIAKARKILYDMTKTA